MKYSYYLDTCITKKDAYNEILNGGFRCFNLDAMSEVSWTSAGDFAYAIEVIKYDIENPVSETRYFDNEDDAIRFLDTFDSEYWYSGFVSEGE